MPLNQIIEPNYCNFMAAIFKMNSYDSFSVTAKNKAVS